MDKHDRLLEEIEAEQEYIKETLKELDEALSRKTKGIIELAAMSTFLQNIYNGIENCLKRILKYNGLSIPSSEDSHKRLIEKAYTIGVITSELKKTLDEYRGFRHFAIHGYGVILEADLLLPLAENASQLWSRFHSEVTEYINTSQ